MSGLGAYPDFMMRAFVRSGHIRGVLDEPGSQTHINPGSVDLATTGDIWYLPSAIIPERGEKVEDMLRKFRATKIETVGAPFIYHPGSSYVIKTAAEFELPPGVYAHFNPKSSSGRDGWLIRAIVDGIDIFDALPKGLPGPRRVYLSVSPTKMPISMSPGETLAQARLFNYDMRFGVNQLTVLYELGERLLFREDEPIPWNEVRNFPNEGSIGVSLDLRQETVIGFRCRESREIIDYSVQQEISRYFEPVYADKDGCLTLEVGFFYILSTAEKVRVPPWMACELLPIKEWLGEIRIHAAGYIDPGWGYGENGEGCGGRITLEVWPQENLVVRPNQIVGLLRYEPMIAVPERHYDQIATSHYRMQSGARPSKRFK